MHVHVKVRGGYMYRISGQSRKSGVAHATVATPSLAPLYIIYHNNFFKVDKVKKIIIIDVGSFGP